MRWDWKGEEAFAEKGTFVVWGWASHGCYGRKSSKHKEQHVRRSCSGRNHGLSEELKSSQNGCWESKCDSGADRDGDVARSQIMQLFSLSSTCMPTHQNPVHQFTLCDFFSKPCLSLSFPWSDLHGIAVLLPPLLDCGDTRLLAALAMKLTFLWPSGSKDAP